MNNRLHQLIKKLQFDFYTMIPESKWNHLYKKLQQELSKDNYSRASTLLVLKKFDEISITTINHDLVVRIPQMLSDLDQVTFTDFFKALSHKRQKLIITLIKQVIENEGKPYEK